MKKAFALLLAMLLLTGCGVSPAKDEPATSDESAATSQNNTDDSSGTIEVDKGLFNVEFTVPAQFFDEETTQESLDETAKEKGFQSVTLNDDGSVTYVMTRTQHEELMSATREQIDAGITDMVESEDYPSITKIESNDDYSVFKVYLSTEDVSLSDSLSALLLYFYGGMYNSFNGTPVDDITVSFINGTTGAVIQEGHSKDIGN